MSPLRIDELTLSRLPEGTVVAIATQNSTYWVTTILGASTNGGILTGLSVLTDSQRHMAFAASPVFIEAVDTVRVGEIWRFGGNRSTSEVVEIRVLN